MVSKHERNVNPGNAEATQREVRANRNSQDDRRIPCVPVAVGEREAEDGTDGGRPCAPTLAELVRNLDKELAYLNGLLELPRTVLFLSTRGSQWKTKP